MCTGQLLSLELENSLKTPCKFWRSTYDKAWYFSMTYVSGSSENSITTSKPPNNNEEDTLGNKSLEVNKLQSTMEKSFLEASLHLCKYENKNL